MDTKRLTEANYFNSTFLIGIIIFCVTLAIFTISKVNQITDSNYSMLLSQSLLDHHSFTLDHYSIPKYEPFPNGEYISNGQIYQLELFDDHIYYVFPPGASILSIPFVYVHNLFGISAANPDGTYNLDGEAKIEHRLARFLMALSATLFFFTARLLLPTFWSLVVTVGGTLGTQVYSTASRALWADTWGIFLLGIVVFLILRSEVNKLRLNPIVLASLLSWMYFVRPTYAVPIFFISIYILIFQRQIFIRYAITGALWLSVFIYYSWSHFGQLLPSYYQGNRLKFDIFWTALAGNLISPSRGLLMYVPVLFFVAYLLIQCRQYLSCRHLIRLSLSIIVAHLIAISGFGHWWGGHSFGPRYTAGLVPWIVLLGILSIRALLDWREKYNSGLKSLITWKLQLGIGGILLTLSIIINTLGATNQKTWSWNANTDVYPNIDEHPERLWHWKDAQFLAPFL